MSEKLIVRVLQELANGPAHSADISDELGISVKTASAVLCDLRDSGMVRPIGQVRLNLSGRASTIWELTKEVMA